MATNELSITSKDILRSLSYRGLLQHREDLLKEYSRLCQEEKVLNEKLGEVHRKQRRSNDEFNDVDSEISIRVVRGEPLEQKA